MNKTGSKAIKRRANQMVKKSDEASEEVAPVRLDKRKKEFPYGQWLFPEIWRTDPTPTGLKSLYMILLLAGLIGLLFLSRVTAWMFPKADNQWDQRNGIHNNDDDDTNWHPLLALPLLVEKSLLLSLESVHYLFQATGAICVLLIVADVVTAGSNTCKTSPYPTSWNTDNTTCYHEMFSEPTRFGRLLRRPGNALSNAPYLLTSLCVFASVVSQHFEVVEEGGGVHTLNFYNIYWLSDALFGAMMFILAVTSFLWHASNAPFSQYPDIWSMDCCIFYLIIRSICMGILGFLCRYTETSPQSAKTIAGGACAAFYFAMIIFSARDKWSWSQKGYLNKGCPFAVRTRLSGQSDMSYRPGETGHQDVQVSAVWLFGSMPVLYLSIPILISAYLLESTGSTMAGDVLAQTLVLGWTHRLFDRWVLDGSPFINYFIAMKPSTIRTVGGAIFSPTASLHFFTGITLLAGYVHTRSLDHGFEFLMK